MSSEEDLKAPSGGHTSDLDNNNSEELIKQVLGEAEEIDSDKFKSKLNISGGDDDEGGPGGGAGELGDIVDEVALAEEEKELSDEELEERFQRSKSIKDEGNVEFKEERFMESIHTYTRALNLCPLKEKEFRAILYSNRSAAKSKLGLKKPAIEDCTKSLENNPQFLKVLLRRAKLYEETEKLDEALEDYKKLIELDPSIGEARAALARLPDQINERNEKLKAEMIGKLKDLGNMILKPFGLSTNNFQLNQDPNSGGYSVNFKQ